MALALYRKYRPRTFAEVIGQEHVTEPLSQALRSGRLHHAYLFSGPRGCGKTSSARILARSLNCEQGPTPEPCGVCASCRSLANDAAGSIDVIEIDAASHGGVDDARDLREKAFFAPASSRYKIYVIDEAHMVSPAGFNALLKLVEEPPDYVKFIFATTEPEKVLGTIKSRTHHYPFRLIPPAVLRPYIQQLADAEGVHVEPPVFPLVVRAGGGSARDTLSVLDQLIAGAGPEGVTYSRAVALLGVTDVTLIDEMCDALAAGDGATAFATIDRVAEAGHDPRRFASDLLERFRDLIIMQQVPDAVTKGLIDGPTDQLDAMNAQATRLGPATLSRCADIVHNGLVEMRGTTAPRLLLELLTARMLLPGADDSTGALLQRLERMERRLTLSSDDVTPARISTGDVEGPASTGDGSAGGGRSAARAAAVAAGRRGSPESAGDGAAAGEPVHPARGGEPVHSAGGGGAVHSAASGGPVHSARGGEPVHSAGGGEPVHSAGGGEPVHPAGGSEPVHSARGNEESVHTAGGGGEPGDGPATATPRGQARDDDADRMGNADGGRESGRPTTATRDGADRPARRAEPAGVLPDAPEEPSAAEPRAPGRLSAAAIRDVWPEIITTLGRKSKRIAALASGATVRDLDGETVVLTFRFPVHADMVAAESEMITEALYEALGGRWQIRCEVSGEAGGSGGSSGATRTQATAAPVRPPAQKTAARFAPAAATRQREVATPAASTDGGDDWPEPARPGGPATAVDPPVVQHEAGERQKAGATQSAGAPQDGGPVQQAGELREADGPQGAGVRRDAGAPQRADAPHGSSVRDDPTAAGLSPDIDQLQTVAATPRMASSAAPAQPAADERTGGGQGPQRANAEPGQPATRRTSAVSASESPPVEGPVPAATVGRGLAAARAAAASARSGVRTAASPTTRAEAGASDAGGAAGSREGALGGASGGRAGARGGGVGVRSGEARADGGSALGADAGSHAWSDGSLADEPPYDPEYDGPPPNGIATYEGFDPGDEPLDDVIDEKAARETSEQQAMRLLQDAFGAEKIGEV